MIADPTNDVEQAREYIAMFRRHLLPGVTWVDTANRRIDLDTLSDEDALFVASEFKRMEIEASGGGCSEPYRRQH